MKRHGGESLRAPGVGGSRPVCPRKPTRNTVGRIPLFLIGVDNAKELVEVCNEGPWMSVLKTGRANYPRGFESHPLH